MPFIQIVFFLGITIMLLSSYATLSSQDKSHGHIEPPQDLMPPQEGVRVTHLHSVKLDIKDNVLKEPEPDNRIGN